MFNPAKAADEIKKEYIGYVSTTFHFKDPKLQQKLESELNKIVSKGPFVEIKDAFKKGRSIRQLCDAGILSPLFADLEKDKKYKPSLPLTRPLYLHQDNAITKIVSGKNVVVSTGTGSGKTHCFLIPVLNELLREKEAGTLNDGVRAIFIYPMNALANDQIKGLREILMAYPDISFGVYNGGTENHEQAAIDLYEAMYANESKPELRHRLVNEKLSRDEMKKNPPHILFTNYAMLEHLLFRPGDDALFSKSKFKYVVLDEAHVYAGATGIETALLMSRLKARLGDSDPQFILTSATLGDASAESRAKVASFASKLTGCAFYSDDIVFGERTVLPAGNRNTYKEELFMDLAEGDKSIKTVLSEYGITFDQCADEDAILYDLLINCDLYARMRSMGELIPLDVFASKLGISHETAVAFVALCAKAKKNGEILIDARYHYFLRALDGAYMALNYPDSFSLTRRNISSNNESMYEIGVCADCGEVAIIGKIEKDKLLRCTAGDKLEFFQLADRSYDNEFDNDTVQIELENANDGGEKKPKRTKYKLCLNCGAIVEECVERKNWCKCGNCQPILIESANNAKCLNCDGHLMRLQIGYEAATGVLATSLFEQIPEYTFVSEDESIVPKKGLFVQARAKRKEMTGSQFLVFSDSRQGAAKFACYMEKSYKEFLRRRGLWHVINSESGSYPDGLTASGLVRLLENYYSSKKLFRESNADNSTSSDVLKVESHRNAWIAVLNELYNADRDTSFVSFGQLQFSYKGNTDEIIDVVVKEYNVDKNSAKALLDYLAFKAVRHGAVRPDKDTDINDDDRKYIFFTSVPQIMTLHKDQALSNAHSFLPTERPHTNGTSGEKYFKQNELTVVKDFLHVSDEDAVEFLQAYWNWLIDSNNDYRLVSDGKGFYMRTDSISVLFGNNAEVWECSKCKKITQYNIGGICRRPNCGGRLTKLNAQKKCDDNYYMQLYKSDKVSPLFIKEHTAQLAKKEALEYQQMFVRKEINALSCSTTFEMGVDVGDLETVFLRNFPPLPSNYAQRVGRAGRSINAAAFALTFARLGSHDFTFFDHPDEMIKGVINPPQFILENEKIIKRHIYAVTIGLYLKQHEEQYNGNNAELFLNNGGYKQFIDWVVSKPTELLDMLKRSIPNTLWNLPNIRLESFGWIDEFCGANGILTNIIKSYEKDMSYLESEREKARRRGDLDTAYVFDNKLKRFKRNELIDFLVRGNILPKYGFPIDSVELAQNIAAKDIKSLNLNRDLAVAIAEYAPSAEIVADGGLYTSRYIRKPIVNRSEATSFDISYIAECNSCGHLNYSSMPIGFEGRQCVVCGNTLKNRDFYKSIEPRAGFIAEKDVKPVPLTSQERKYRTEAMYIGDKDSEVIDTFEYEFNGHVIKVQSTANDSLVVHSLDHFYVCPSCGYTIAADEASKLKEYSDYKANSIKIKDGPQHDSPFAKGKCSNTELHKYKLHHEFKTDVAKIEFDVDTRDQSTMLSVMYAILNAFAIEMSIERRDIKACLTYKLDDGKYSHQIIIYDAVPGGAGHSRRLVTESGDVLFKVLKRAKKNMICDCSPSCYKCLRNYENQKIHELLDHQKAFDFLNQFVP